MATAEDFAEVEWAVICDAAHGAGMTMMLLGSSGLVGSMKEMLVAGRTAANAAKHESELIRAICEPEAMRAMQKRVADVLSEGHGGDPRRALREKSLDWLGEAVEVLRKKAPEELGAYREWVAGFASEVAHAASEGGLLGIRGEKVSVEEAQYLSALRAILAADRNG
jgi:hypothetical protein